jgi:glycolate oxidase FAD binding subunit
MTDADADQGDQLVEALHRARETGSRLYISGGGSKQHLSGRACLADDLDVSGHRGIIDYEPGELVITARGGTPVAELLATLREERQTLSFEPPVMSGRASLGGTLACNLSGPGRPWGGSIRDRVLGIQLINGRGERLNFGGRVMKNVAGYDVSRLQAGALGTLGILSEISLRVEPLPERSLTLRFGMAAPEAIETMNRRAGEPAPLTGAFWLQGQLHLRLAGAASAVRQTAQRWGGEQLEGGAEPWDDLREMTLPFFTGDTPLWRLSVDATAPAGQEPAMLIDWCGAQRWLRGEFSRGEMDRLAAEAGGHATLFRGGDRSAEVRPPLSATETGLHQRLKRAFDPDGILNPGRLYSWL